MDDSQCLANRFEDDRPRLRAVAYRMLGSLPDAEDALQDTWERLSRAGTAEVENLGGWMTTVLARVCLNMLRARGTRGEGSGEVRLPDPIVTPDGNPGPEEEALVAASVGLALQVVLDTLTPPERLAFVLHDLFDLPFEEIAPVVARTPQAARQLASRGRRRVRGATVPPPDPDLARQRAVVEAFFSASRAGDLDALVCLLDPDVVLRADFGPRRRSAATTLRGAATVARRAMLGARPGTALYPALINGAAGMVITM
ncbi:MAG TPA: sigma-70 family RNA polymerase sigma factor, partial [Acidimicrobiales bacterium]|nr:sigma-70 family RNA polymerase sigma factor [Acidimicrobiales bacterium]